MEITINIDSLVEAINNLAAALNGRTEPEPELAPVQEVAEVQQTVAQPEAPAPVAEIKLEDVRKRLAALANSGKQETIKGLLAVYNAKKLSDLKPEDYGSLMALLDESEATS